MRGRALAQPLDPSVRNAARAPTVVVAGHSAPPQYLGYSADVVARAVAAWAPELVVFDTCFGASFPILIALARALPGVLAVAAPFWVRGAGLVYDEPFFGDGPREVRAAAVRANGPRRLFRATLDAAALEAAAASPPRDPILEAPGLARVAFAGEEVLAVVEEAEVGDGR